MTRAQTIEQLDATISRMATSKTIMTLFHYNVALSRYYLFNNPTKAELLLASMKDAGIDPDIATYNVQLDHAIKTSNSVRVDALLKEIQTLGLQHNDVTHALLAKHWVALGDFNSIELMLDNLTARNTVPNKFFWSKLIDGYARQNNAAAAERTAERMHRLGKELDVYSLGALLQAFVSVGSTDKCRAMMTRALEQGVKTNAVVWNTFINALLQERKLPLAQRITNAEEALEQMLSQHIMIDNYVACTMLRAYNEAMQWEKGNAFLRRALQLGLKPSTAVFNALMAAWVGQNRIEDAEVCVVVVRPLHTPLTMILQKVLEQVEKNRLKPTIISYNILIHAYCEKGDGEKALSALKRAQERGLAPNEATYDIIARGLLAKGDTMVAAELLTQMIGKRMPPSRPALETLVGQLIDKKNLKEAENWIAEMLRLSLRPHIEHVGRLIVEWARVGNISRSEHWRTNLMRGQYKRMEKIETANKCDAQIQQIKRGAQATESQDEQETPDEQLQTLLDQ